MKPSRSTRRHFMKQVGLGAAAMTLPNLFATRSRSFMPAIGFQLYTIRKEIEKDLEGSIRKVAEMGFLGVETYPLPENITLEQAAKVFKDNGLEVFGMHTEVPIDDERERVLAMAEIYDCPNVVYPGWPKDLDSKDPKLMERVGEIFETKEKVKKTADLYNEVSAFLKSKGLRFGLHNHWWEFEECDGIIPFFYLLENLNTEVFFEIDTYWVTTAGQDAASVVADFGPRAPFLHIKDGPATKGENMYAHVPAGAGVVNFSAVAKAGGENIRWMIVEFDEYAGDMFEGMQASYDYLTNNSLAKGRS